MRTLSFIGSLAVALSGCAIADATTPAQRGYAIEQQFAALQQSVLAYVSQPGADATVKRRLKEAELTARHAVEGQDAAAAATAVAALAAELQTAPVTP